MPYNATNPEDEDELMAYLAKMGTEAGLDYQPERNPTLAASQAEIDLAGLDAGFDVPERAAPEYAAAYPPEPEPEPVPPQPYAPRSAPADQFQMREPPTRDPRFGAPSASPAPARAFPSGAPDRFQMREPPARDPRFDGYQFQAEAPAEPGRRYELPEPPMREKPSTGMALLAAFADLHLNKGRGGPQILKPLFDDQSREAENYQRRVQHIKDQAALDRGGQRGAHGGLGDQLGIANYQLNLRRVQNAENAAAEKARIETALGKLDSPETQAEREGAILAGLDPAEMNKATGHQIIRFRTALMQERSQAQGMTNWGIQERERQGNRERTADYGEDIDLAKEDRTKEQAEAARQIPGWSRTPDAPPISTNETQNARKIVEGWNQLRTAVQKLQALDAVITPEERLKGVLFDDNETALAQQLQQEAGQALRMIANFGTPQAAELALTNSRIPALTSIQGFLNGAQRYAGLLEAMEGSVGAQMSTYGYNPGQAAPRRRAPPKRGRDIRGGGGGGPAPSPSRGPSPGGRATTDEDLEGL